MISNWKIYANRERSKSSNGLCPIRRSSRPGKTRQDLTEDAAGEFAALAHNLRSGEHDPGAIAHFINRLVFCMFAEDVDLLPTKMFVRMLEAAKASAGPIPASSRRACLTR